MRDRQFIVMLVLVIAAGLVMGLVAFRVSGSPAAVAGPANGTASANGGARPAGADGDVVATDQPGDPIPQATGAETTNGEPTTPAKDPPPMQGPTNADPPGTAAVTPSQLATNSDTPQ